MLHCHAVEDRAVATGYMYESLDVWFLRAKRHTETLITIRRSVFFVDDDENENFR